MFSESVYYIASTKRPQLSNAVQHSIYRIDYGKCIWFCMASMFILLKVIWWQLNPVDRKCFWIGEEVSSILGGHSKRKALFREQRTWRNSTLHKQDAHKQTDTTDGSLQISLSSLSQCLSRLLCWMLSSIAFYFVFFPLVLSIIRFLMTSKCLRISITWQKPQTIKCSLSEWIFCPGERGDSSREKGWLSCHQPVKKQNKTKQKLIHN